MENYHKTSGYNVGGDTGLEESEVSWLRNALKDLFALGQSEISAQVIQCLDGPLAMSFILSGLLCASGQDDVTYTLLSINMFMAGLATILQNMFGVRLGVIQSSSFSFVAPIIAMMTLDKWSCPNHDKEITGLNTTKLKMDEDEIWKIRMREIQGNLILASITQIVLGCTGVIGFLLRFTGPLTIAPTIALIGISLTGSLIDLCKPHWGISFMTMCLTLTFGLYIGKLKLPLPAWSKKEHCYVVRFPVFQVFTILLSVGVSWLICYILTVTEVFPNNPEKPSYMARTDARVEVLKTAPWFYWPYPFQFGMPTFSAAGYVGFLAATVASIIESVGDYHAAARIGGVPPPPPHAINRGVAVEGFSSIISGMIGAGPGTTTYSGVIGAIGITKVASRAVFITAGFVMVICGVVGKFGAFLTSIPYPVVGGAVIVPVGMVVAVGISTLKFIDLESTRNLTIFGTSIFLGLMIPQYINDPENANVIDTGNEELDQVIKVLLGTSMFVGGFVGCLLDNTVSGTDEERGILSWRKRNVTTFDASGRDASLSMYEYPYVTKYFRRLRVCSYIPVSPTFDKGMNVTCSRACCRPKTKRNNVSGEANLNQYAFDNTESFAHSASLDVKW
ncbi:solute carrier family 23 member 2-like [Mercenaria mercenaria]|uniref:solute carrier family 23 member 2-like n=1 Tax=Mercenaria mercenaria TaxID=6596 RepID=UPI00234E904F|nr:solute carrier family 23 member 2-like [Mercenaria mercenaria]